MVKNRPTERSNMDANEDRSYWTFEAALARAIEDYRDTDENELGLPYHASRACEAEALEASWQGDSALCVKLIADLTHDGILALGYRGVSEEEIARKVLAPLLEMGLTVDMGPEKQQILDRRYAAAMSGLPQIAE